MEQVKVKTLIEEYSVKNKRNLKYPVYSVTNKRGFCKDYFTKDVSSKDKSNYKIVPYNAFAYNPSRINIGSVDCQRCEKNVIVSPLYNVFKCNEKIDPELFLYYIKSESCVKQIKEKSTLNVRANFKLKTFGEFNIKLYNKKEQAKILAELKTITNIINKYKKVILCYDELIISKYHEMFKNVNENKKLDEVLDYIQPQDYIVDSDYYDDEYDTPVLTAGKTFILGYTNEKKGVFNATKNNPIILFDDFTTAKQWVDFNFKVKSSACKILVPKSKTINLLYLYYAMNTININTELHKRYWISSFSQETIKYPNIQMQNRFSKYVEEINRQKCSIEKVIQTCEELLNAKIYKYLIVE